MLVEAVGTLLGHDLGAALAPPDPPNTGAFAGHAPPQMVAFWWRFERNPVQSQSESPQPHSSPRSARIASDSLFDASALVKRYVGETGSVTVRKLLSEPAATSRLLTDDFQTFWVVELIPE